MLTNHHTHCTFCDGKDAAEEVVISALNKGFAAIGFSSHGGFVNAAQEYSAIDIEAFIRQTGGHSQVGECDRNHTRTESGFCGRVRNDRAPRGVPGIF